ncbi:hypothetical protein QFC22_004955 [Naganishia vaughanmartiniae]|uniref:Uncharacterized protein n=1 Tax=Naganishia vaughanmartiniae TaxID=1424756 RepID=A0ACC2WXF6_9TREE|nr:hypothetical protein QFC22_004955 [Naganishia vaughanmartiniae]
MSDLPTLMQGKDSLSRWDMMVAYDEATLNTLLAERTSEIPDILDGLKQFDVTYTNLISGKQITLYTVDMHFKTPTMSFDTTPFGSIQGAIVVNFPITGTTTEDGVTKDLPTDLILSCCTPLVSVSGETNQVSPPGTVVIFDPNSPTSTETVTLDFTKPSMLLTVTPGSTTNPKLYEESVLSTVSAYFSKAGGFRYRLAGLTNAIPKDPAGNAAPIDANETLLPSTFLFTLDPGDPNAKPTVPGCLLTWIGLKGSTSVGIQPTTRDALRFNLGGPNTVSPLMPLSTASIIIAHDTMWNFFLKPGIIKSHGTVPTSTSVQSTAGMTFQATLPSFQVDAPGSDPKQDGFGAFSFNLNAGSSKFVVDHVGITWTFTDSQQIDIWEIEDEVYGGSWKNKGHADVTCTVSDSATWTSTDGANVLAMKFGGAPKLIKTTASPSSDRSVWDKITMGETPNVPDAWNGLKITAPAITLDFGGLDYFLGTNLLFPGAHIFKADPVATGFYIPRDTLITGNLYKPTTTVKRGGLLGAVQPTKTSLTTLINRFAAPTGGLILGDFLLAVGDKNDSLGKVEEFLKKYNIEDWTGDELSSITGQKYNTSSAAAVQDLPTVSEASSQGHSALQVGEEPLPFDIRVFGAWYKITAPATMPDGNLLVNPQTGKITVQNMETTPTVKVGADGTNTVSFTVGTSTFAVVFDSKLDTSTGTFTLSFKGSVTYPSGSVEDFNGKQYVPEPGDAGIGSGFAKTINILALVGFGITVFGCVGILQSYLYRREDKKKDTETPEAKARRELTERHNAAVDRQLQDIRQYIRSRADEQAARFEPEADARIMDRVYSAAQVAARDASSGVDLSRVRDESSLDLEEYRGLLDSSNRAAASEVELQVTAEVSPNVRDDITPWCRSGVLSTAAADGITSAAVSNATQAKQSHVRESGLVPQIALAVALAGESQQQHEIQRNVQSNLDSLALKSAHVKAEKSAASTVIQEYIERIKAEPDSSTKEEAEAALKEEQAALEEIVKKETEVENARGEQEQERDQAASRIEESDKAAEKAEHEAGEAKHRAAEP